MQFPRKNSTKNRVKRKISDKLLIFPINLLYFLLLIFVSQNKCQCYMLACVWLQTRDFVSQHQFFPRNRIGKTFFRIDFGEKSRFSKKRLLCNSRKSMKMAKTKRMRTETRDAREALNSLTFTLSSFVFLLLVRCFGCVLRNSPSYVTVSLFFSFFS